MECVIADVSGIRTLSKVVQCASKIGDDVTFTHSSSGLQVRVVNSSKSALADFCLRPPFFSNFLAPPPGRRVTTCVSARALLPIFRAPAAIDAVRVVIDVDNARLVLRVSARTALRKTFRIPVHDGAAPATVFNKDTCSSFLQTRPRFFMDILTNFHGRLDEITFDLSASGVRVSSFVDTIAAADPHRAMLRTEMEVPAREFDVYRVSLPASRSMTPVTPDSAGDDISLTFYCKPFRAVLEFCEILDAPMCLWFASSGQPLIFTTEYGAPGGAVHFDATFVFATRLVRESSQTQTPGSSEKQTSSRGNEPSSGAPPSRAPSSRAKRPHLSLAPVDASKKDLESLPRMQGLEDRRPSAQRPPAPMRRDSAEIVTPLRTEGEHRETRDRARPASAGSATGTGGALSGAMDRRVPSRHRHEALLPESDLVLPTPSDGDPYPSVGSSLRMRNGGGGTGGDDGGDNGDGECDDDDGDGVEFVPGTPPPT